ncbi:hypothetical protein ACGF4C_16175 [Streptomyces sp. NPDC048197]|uniref:hypothetical protein n=1 Tax=Streptomyces sp. NPDC048197 TaxID=3365511 RepID=UPI00371B7D03
MVRSWAGLGGDRGCLGIAVGRPIGGVELRTAEDEEIEVRRTVGAGCGVRGARRCLRVDGVVEPAIRPDGWFAIGDGGQR